MELLQRGPVVTHFDVGGDFRFSGGAGGVYYNTEVCDNYEEEDVPPECAREGGGYTCHRDCKYKMPKHCDRCVKLDLRSIMSIPRTGISSVIRFNS